VREEELVELYNAASFAAYPSLYEGFGLPVIEAMACGTPLIASNSTSIPEIAGGAAVLVDPCSETEIASAMVRLAGSSPLRAQFREMGIVRSAEFSIKKLATETLAIYAG